MNEASRSVYEDKSVTLSHGERYELIAIIADYMQRHPQRNNG